MAVPRSLKNATVTLTDNDGGNTATLTLEDGNLTINLPNPAQHVPDRGQPGTVIDGLHENITWSMDVQVQSLTASDNILEILYGTASGWTFTEADLASGTYNGKSCSLQDVASAVKVFQMSVALADPAGGSTETLFLLNNVATANFSEGMPDKFSLSGECMGYSGADFEANIA